MNDPDYASFFNVAAALFPILVLTKTVSFRNRRTSSTKPYKDTRLLSRLTPGTGHVVHVLAATAGEIFAILGIFWHYSKGLVTWPVVVLLILAAIPLVVELLVDATRP